MKKNLIERLKQGDKEAEYELYRTYERRILKRIKSGNPIFEKEQVITIYHDTIVAFINLVVSGRFKGLQNATLETYLNRIAYNKSVDLFRELDKQKKIFTLGDKNIVLQLEDSKISDDALREEQKKKILRILEGMSPECLYILHLYYYKGFTIEVIAEKLVVSNAVVRKRKERCINKIRERFPQFLRNKSQKDE